jgi:plasmid maintenance system antidote protein VapI
MARKVHHQNLMAPERIAEIAHLVAGAESGWQSRFAAALGVTRTHVANLVSGNRPATDDMRRAIAAAAENAADDFEKRAKELRKRAAKLRF